MIPIKLIPFGLTATFLAGVAFAFAPTISEPAAAPANPTPASFNHRGSTRALRPNSGEAPSDLRQVQRQYNDQIRPLLKQYCGDCHWGQDSEADFDLQGYETLDQLLNGRKKVEKSRCSGRSQ